MKLDVTKPMRVVSTGACKFSYVATDTTNGDVYVRLGDGSISVYRRGELENIPEKIIQRRKAILFRGNQIVWEEDYYFGYGKIMGSAWVEIAEGDGMAEEK